MTTTNPLDEIIGIDFFNRPQVNEKPKPIVKEKSKTQPKKSNEKKLVLEKTRRKEKSTRKQNLEKELQTILEQLPEAVIMATSGRLKIKNKKYTITYSIKLN